MRWERNRAVAGARRPGSADRGQRGRPVVGAVILIGVRSLASSYRWCAGLEVLVRQGGGSDTPGGEGVPASEVKRPVPASQCSVAAMNVCVRST